jgi:hypothetical protein
MLVQKEYAAGDIVGFKLVNGDEVIGKIVESNDSAYTLSKPLLLVPSVKGVALMQAMISADINNSVTLNKTNIIMHSEAMKDLVDHYLQTVTGIQPVTKGGIIT